MKEQRRVKEMQRYERDFWRDVTRSFKWVKWMMKSVDIIDEINEMREKTKDSFSYAGYIIDIKTMGWWFNSNHINWKWTTHNL